jgi:hypothetical protein
LAWDMGFLLFGALLIVGAARSCVRAVRIRCREASSRPCFEARKALAGILAVEARTGREVGSRG